MVIVLEAKKPTIRVLTGLVSVESWLPRWCLECFILLHYVPYMQKETNQGRESILGSPLIKTFKPPW
jgi:hypothetical protein